MSEDKNLNDDFKEKAKEFAEEAKETAKEFTEGAQETFESDNKKVLAGILAILLGYLGIHKFVLGYTKEGIIQLIASVVTCGIASIIPFIEGIIYLTKSDDDFYNTYQVGKKPWF
ncbi:TM2 domain-containing protein [Aestuariibaculum marinum]|uniref:TM2 domain-containing protein n=1 Tax=Aestuariibaculum marinum TaxID=2683592 RepID=A0A8J6U4R3_9FLAO|nr:TM2 domain-containing protein [Aestuariibaculum marinum]MBD0823154.1 TM2 domain-containing protein [Aestuariibaculum marinum]